MPPMARPLRIEYPGAFYHVMNRGLLPRQVFVADQDRNAFLDLVDDISQLWKVAFYADALMDTRYHVFLQTPLNSSGE